MRTSVCTVARPTFSRASAINSRTRGHAGHAALVANSLAASAIQLRSRSQTVIADAGGLPTP